MMKVTIEFNIEGEDQFEEQNKLNQVMAASDAFTAIWDISQLLREHYKYPENFEGQDQVEIINERFHEILQDNNIDMDRLYR